MANFIQQKINFLHYELWRVNTTELTGIKRVFYSVLKTIVLVVRGFISKDLNIRANALTYSLLFAIVPILAMVLAIAKGFNMSEIIEQQLRNSFIGETDMVDNIMAFVERYLETAQGGVFLGIGLLILLWAVYSFFQTVETAFNNIWDVQNSRSIPRQLTTYIAILFMIPVLIIVSAGLSIFFNTAMESFPWLEQLRQQQSNSLHVVQWATSVIVFTWMYIAIPNTKVNFISGLIPGILVGTLYTILQLCSVYVIMFLSRTSIVYGAFASIPILLTWLQWTCLLILIGAQMSFSIQNKEMFDYEHDLEHMSRRYKDFVTLYILSIIIRRFENDEKPISAHELAKDYHLPARLVNQLVGRLVEVELLREIYIEGSENRTYQPALDTHKITIELVMSRIEQQGTELFLANDEQRQDFWEKYLKIKNTNTPEQILVSRISD